MMQDRTVIIGGGLAGLAAAVALTDRGVPVLLLESRPRLGGRASSFIDRVTGESVDNCQHVSMGCCTNLRHFCRLVGTEARFRVESALTFIGPDGSANRFAASPLPAPLHLLPAFVRLDYLTWGEKLRLARGLRRLARLNPAEAAGRSMRDWLAAQHQTKNLIERFWDVVLVSALSESLDRIDLAHARKVFVDGFLANRHGWEVHIPTVPLDDLYGEWVIRWLVARGSAVRLQSGVASLETSASSGTDRIDCGVLRTGERIDGADFVLAVPWHRVSDLLPPVLGNDPELAGISQLESAPIASVHLWFDRPITDRPHAVLIGRTSQWMFNRTQLQTSPVDPGSSPASDATAAKSSGSLPSGGYNYQVVISASRHLAALSQEETIQTVVRELTAVWPAAADARLLHARLVTEHRAVFSVTPGVDRLRPAQQSPLPNLQFAGDWTRTGWPATMEGAVRSGFLAAENVLARRGRPATLVQADPPVAWLARLLMGLP